jgi:CspA family cold shock protein
MQAIFSVNTAAIRLPSVECRDIVWSEAHPGRLNNAGSAPREGVAVRIRRRAPVQQGGLPGGPERATRDRKGDKTMPTGTVKWFNATKGYGFIGPESGGKDIFVHISAVQKAGLRTLNEGQRLAFEVEQQANGRAAAVNLAETG